jgi:dihydroneopterin aldolase
VCLPPAARGRSVRGVVQGPPRQLVEAVAADVAATLLRDFPAAAAVDVRVCKPHVAMPGALHSLGARARTRMHAEQSNTRC